MKTTETIKVDHDFHTYTCEICGSKIDPVQDQSICGMATVERVFEEEGVSDEPHLMAEVLDTCGVCFYKVQEILEKALGVKFRREHRYERNQ
jgi:hypothetical protein